VFCIKFTVFSWSTGKNDAETCALLVNNATYSGTSLPTFRDNLSVPFSVVSFLFGFLILEDETHRLSRKVGTQLPLHPA